MYTRYVPEAVGVKFTGCVPDAKMVFAAFVMVIKSVVTLEPKVYAVPAVKVKVLYSPAYVQAA
jgi:hypothetical protein